MPVLVSMDGGRDDVGQAVGSAVRLRAREAGASPYAVAWPHAEVSP
ncbi:MAG TPA: hypothetical protein VFV66_04680 [Nonomuraea sp.]|nr:hypothetical protein [Nonomuraea sp.]